MPVRYCNSSVLRWPDLAQVDAAVRAWASNVAGERPELRRLGYFGSYARGDWGVGSDLDLVAVVEHSDQPFERRAVGWDLGSLPVPADLLVYTQSEWRQLEQADTPFGAMLLRETVWVFAGRFTTTPC